MRCVRCKKIVPSVSTVCPYCGGDVTDDNSIVIEEEKNEEPEEKEETNLLKTLLSSNNKTFLYIIIGVVVFFVFLLVMIAMSSSSKKESAGSSKTFTNVLDDFMEFLDDMYFDNSYSNSGSFDFYIKIDDNENEFTGKYGYDLKNKIVNISSTMIDPEQNNGKVIVNAKEFNLDLYYDKGDLYVNSPQLYDKDVLFKFDFDNNLLTNNKYDITTAVTGLSDALTYALRKMTYKSKSEKISFLGEDKTFNKTYFVMDNEAKVKFFDEFYGSLAEDSSFLNEVAKITGGKSDDVKKIFENYMTSAEYKYSGDSDYKTTVSMYTSNGVMKRFEINDDSDDGNQIIRVDVDDSRYHFYYYKDDYLVYEASILVTIKELEDKTIRNYEITFNSDDHSIDVNLKLYLDSKTKVEKKSNIDSINYVDLSSEEVTGFKTILNSYITGFDFINNLDTYFVDKCGYATNCRCGLDTCSCLYNDTEVITCAKAKVVADVIVSESDEELTTSTVEDETTIQESTTETTTLETTSVQGGLEETTTTMVVNQQ